MWDVDIGGSVLLPSLDDNVATEGGCDELNLARYVRKNCRSRHKTFLCIEELVPPQRMLYLLPAFQIDEGFSTLDHHTAASWGGDAVTVCKLQS
jgi:hypothetical protein